MIRRVCDDLLKDALIALPKQQSYDMRIQEGQTTWVLEEN
jgi:hypothetical protein